MLNKLKMDDDDKLLSTLFNEVTWSGVTKGFITSCVNIKSDGWAKIGNGAISFAKVNHHIATLVNLTDTPKVKKNEHANLHKDFDSEEGEFEEQPNNGIHRISQGTSQRMRNRKMRNHLPHHHHHHLLKAIISQVSFPVPLPYLHNVSWLIVFSRHVHFGDALYCYVCWLNSAHFPHMQERLTCFYVHPLSLPLLVLSHCQKIHFSLSYHWSAWSCLQYLMISYSLKFSNTNIIFGYTNTCWQLLDEYLTALTSTWLHWWVLDSRLDKRLTKHSPKPFLIKFQCNVFNQLKKMFESDLKKFQAPQSKSEFCWWCRSLNEGRELSCRKIIMPVPRRYYNL